MTLDDNKLNNNLTQNMVTDKVIICIAHDLYLTSLSPPGRLGAFFVVCSMAEETFSCIMHYIEDCKQNDDAYAVISMFFAYQSLANQECIDSCAWKPCQYNGKCAPDPLNNPVCTCSPGYHGKHCEIGRSLLFSFENHICYGTIKPKL